jgi:hypothetical protein
VLSRWPTAQSLLVSAFLDTYPETTHKRTCGHKFRPSFLEPRFKSIDGLVVERAVGVEKLSIVSRERKPGEDEKRL